jgi:hypothetical protein
MLKRSCAIRDNARESGPAAEAFLQEGLRVIRGNAPLPLIASGRGNSPPPRPGRR